jgi:hypothetical protein
LQNQSDNSVIENGKRKQIEDREIHIHDNGEPNESAKAVGCTPVSDLDNSGRPSEIFEMDLGRLRNQTAERQKTEVRTFYNLLKRIFMAQDLRSL